MLCAAGRRKRITGLGGGGEEKGNQRWGFKRPLRLFSRSSLSVSSQILPFLSRESVSECVCVCVCVCVSPCLCGFLSFCRSVILFLYSLHVRTCMGPALCLPFLRLIAVSCLCLSPLCVPVTLSLCPHLSLSPSCLSSFSLCISALISFCFCHCLAQFHIPSVLSHHHQPAHVG